MSTTRLMILGLVRWLQPVHGYDVRRELLSWEVETWANIAPGSIYHALRKLTEDGMLAEVATEQVGSRPARTTYRVTEAGEREFATLLRDYWSQYRAPVDPFMSAFSFLPALPRSEAVRALRERADGIEASAQRLRAEMAAPQWFDGGRPAHVAWHLELMLARWETDTRWARDVADRVEAGAGLHEGEYDLAEAGARWRDGLDEQFGAPDDDG